MSLWQYLLSVRSSGTLRFAGVEVGWRLWLPVLGTVLIILLAAFVVGFFYWLEPRRIGRGRRGTMIALRMLAITLLAVVIFRPLQFTALFQGDRPRGVTILVDNSQSMSLQDRRLSVADKLRVALAHNIVPLGTAITDEEAARKVASGISDNPRRIDLVKALVEHPELKLLEKAENIGPLKVLTFGTRTRRITARDDQSLARTLVSDLSATEPQTALADALAEVLFRGDGDLPAAIVVLTDGLEHDSNASLAEVAQEAGRMGVPIHLVGIGSTEAGLVQLREAPAPDMIFLDDTIAIPFRYRVQGIKQGTVKLSVMLGNKEVATREVPVREGDEVRELLTFTPRKDEIGKEEMQVLTTKVSLKENPSFSDELQRSIRIIDKKVRVLYVENIARWDFQFIQRGLMRDRRVEPSFLILQGDKETMTSGKPFLPAFPASRKDLFAYDLIILGDVPADKIGTEAMGWIREFVQEGGGLVTIAGRINAPATWHGTPLETLLPIEFKRESFAGTGDKRVPGFQPVLTRQGQRSQMLSLADTMEDNQKTWSELPNLYWFYPVTRLKPGAVSLLAHPTEKAADEPMPLLALQYFGKGQVLFVGFEETWRWRFNRQDTVFARFWGQVVYQLGLRGSQGSLRTQLTMDRTQATIGRLGKVYARLLDANLHPLTQKTVTATLESFDAKPPEPRTRQVELQLVPGSEGEYQLNLVHDKAGRFALKLGGDDPARVDYRVEVPVQHELSPLPLPVRMLTETAEASKGGFYREEDLPRLTDSLKPQKAVFQERSSIPLLNPLTFLVFLLLITTEWIVRKFSNLS
jgi:uncharacterized membrane protein